MFAYKYDGNAVINTIWVLYKYCIKYIISTPKIQTSMHVTDHRKITLDCSHFYAYEGFFKILSPYFFFCQMKQFFDNFLIFLVKQKEGFKLFAGKVKSFYTTFLAFWKNSFLYPGSNIRKFEISWFY